MQVDFSLAEIEQIAREILNRSHHRIFLFEGEMGAGKTTLIKAMVGALGSTDQVASPTFSLVNEYTSQRGNVFHFDFYRISKQEEALDLGFEEYLSTDSYCFIEWPERITKYLPEQATTIQLIKLEADLRRVIMGTFTAQ